MVFGCFAGAPGRGFRCLTVHCFFGLQKRLLGAEIHGVWLFRRCPRTRLSVLDCTFSLDLQKMTFEAGFLTPFGS